MSYEIVKNISFKKNKIIITSASSNVYPKEFKKWEYEGSFGEFIFAFGESLQPLPSANKGKAIYLVNMLYNLFPGKSNYKDKDLNIEIFNSTKFKDWFMGLWKTKISTDKYKVTYKDYNVNIIRGELRYGKGDCKVLNYYQARNILLEYPKYKLNMEIIE